MNRERKNYLLLSKKNSRRRWNPHKTFTNVEFDSSFDCLFIFMLFNQLFQTNTQSFNIALSHINIRTRNQISADVLIIRRRNKYPREGPGENSKKFPEKISQCQKNCRTVPKMNHSLSLYNAEHTRLVPRTENFSAANQNRVLRHPTQTSSNFASQSESSITSPESSITSPERSQPVLKNLLGSRLESARVSLSYYTGSSTPPPT